MPDAKRPTRTFTDTAGRVWLVELHPLNMKRVRELTGTNLGAVLNDEMRGLRDLFADAVLFADVLCVLCRDEAEKRNVSDEDFGRALGGGVLEEAADAFLGALADFSRSQVRVPLLALAQKEKEYAARMAAVAAEKIAEIDVDAVIALQTSNGLAGNSPALSASIPPG